MRESSFPDGGNGLLGAEPLCPCSKHRNWGCFIPEGNVWLLAASTVGREHEAAQWKGSDPSVRGLVQSVWAALQTGSAKGVLHKHPILLLMVLSLLVFNQVMGGCWYWLNSLVILSMEKIKCLLWR